MNMAVGIVVNLHPEDHSVDLVMVEDGARLAGVQVLADMASTRTGRNDLHETGSPQGDDPWSVSSARDKQDIVAVVAYIGRQPVVMGFLFPQVCQMLFDRLNFRVERHPSDVYSTIDNSANCEWSHPSGSYLRVAEDPEHEDLTGQDVDQKWKIDRNTDRAPWVSLMIKNAGAEVARLRVDPAGNVLLQHTASLTVHTGADATVTIAGNASVTVGQNMTAHVSGSTTVTSGGAASLTAPSVLIDTPGCTVTGKLTVGGGMAVSGGSAGATAQITGNVQVTGSVDSTGTLTNNGVNVGSTHVHAGVQTGGGNTATPH